MGSKSNPNPWSPYDSYNDCSQGICNMYCPQWCYFLFPPPPPSSSSSTTLSPLLIALIGILGSAFILISYYTLISKYCHRHRSSSSSSESPGRDGGGFFTTEARRGDGLNDSLIKSITVYKYRKGDGFVECSDCSVCLSEFEEEESLRLLPKCNHAFHLPCIDTWLKSHSNCPLCRAFVTPEVDHQQSSVHQITTESSGGAASEMSSSVAEHRAGDSVLVIEDLEMNVNNGSHPKPPEEEEHRQQPIRRSVSLNSGLVLSTGDVLRDVEEDDEEIRCSVALKRSVSTGRFIFPRGPRDYSLPN